MSVVKIVTEPQVLRYLLICVAVFCVLQLLAGCSGGRFSVRDLAKSDTDLVTEAHYEESQRLLRGLMVKLYKRNPREWRKSGSKPAMLVARVFDNSGALVFDELGGISGIEAIELAMSPGYEGDRVFALMAGLNHMLRQSYGFHDEFFIFTELSEQQLYYSARNLEITAWRLAQRRGSDGKPLLLTNSMTGAVSNLSYERTFGKLIAIQDMMATVMAQKNRRLINKVAQNVATMAFFPL